MTHVDTERLEEMLAAEIPLGMSIADARSIITELLSLRSQQAPAGVVKDDEEEIYQIGKRDGYGEAVQDIDLLTGGDGEYRYCTDHDPERHTPDAEAMKARIVERFESLTSPLDAGGGDNAEVLRNLQQAIMQSHTLADLRSLRKTVEAIQAYEAILSNSERTGG